VHYECVKKQFERIYVSPRLACIKTKNRRKEHSMRISNNKISVLGSAILIVAFALMSGSPVLAAGNQPPLSVNVVNTPSQPVPVAITGTPPVEVVNDTLYTPYILQASAESSETLTNVTFNVPVGKRLVVETVSAQVTPENGQQEVRLTYNVKLTDGPFGLMLGFLQVQPTGPTSPYYVANQPLKMRVDHVSGQEITFSATHGGTGSLSLIVTLYGYLVDLP
jgi:hypothetical protein